MAIQDLTRGILQDESFVEARAFLAEQGIDPDDEDTWSICSVRVGMGTRGSRPGAGLKTPRSTYEAG